MDLRFADNNTFNQSRGAERRRSGCRTQAYGRSLTSPAANTWIQSPIIGAIVPTVANLYRGRLQTGCFRCRIQTPRRMYSPSRISCAAWMARRADGSASRAITRSTMRASPIPRPSPAQRPETAFNRSYTIPANTLNMVGATIRSMPLRQVLDHGHTYASDRRQAGGSTFAIIPATDPHNERRERTDFGPLAH